MVRHGDDVDRSTEWDAMRLRHLKPAEAREPSAARGVHHLALLSRDVERTIAFYQDVLEFPLTELFENRDYQGSTHFFFDIGNGNLLAFFDFPGLDLGEYAEVLGGLHHLALSVEPERWQHLKGKLDDACMASMKSEAFQKVAKNTLQPADFMADSAGFTRNIDKDLAEKQKLLTALGLAK